MSHNISKPALTRLARKAGVKTMSEECIPFVQDLIKEKLKDILKTSIVFSQNKKNKIILIDDLYHTLELEGINVCSN